MNRGADASVSDDLLPPAGMIGTPGPLLSIVRDRRLAFAMVGGANTVIGYAFYSALIWLGLHYVAALIVAYAAATLVAFGLHRNLVFRVRGHLFRDLWRFSLVNISALLINLALLPIAVSVIGLNPYIGQIAVALITMVISYVGHRDFSFHRKPHPAQEQL